MSAYVVDTITITRILGVIDFMLEDGNPKQSIIESALRQAGFPIEMKDRLERKFALNRLGTGLLALNVQSVHDFYNGRHDKSVGYPMTFLPHRPYTLEDVRQSLESIKCWSYQSCEGTCDESPLYKLIDHGVRIAVLEYLVDEYGPRPEEEWR